jgi:hypothetical protein
MPQVERSSSGAVIIRYNECELDDHIGYRLMKLERRFDVLEERVKELELKVGEIEMLVKRLIEKFYI